MLLLIKVLQGSLFSLLTSTETDELINLFRLPATMDTMMQEKGDPWVSFDTSSPLLVAAVALLTLFPSSLLKLSPPPKKYRQTATPKSPKSFGASLFPFPPRPFSILASRRSFFPP